MDLKYYQDIFKQTKNALIQAKISSGKNTNSISDAFKKVVNVYKVDRDIIFVEVPDKLIKFRMERFFANDLNEISEKILNKKVLYKFLTPDEVLEDKEKSLVFTTPDNQDKIRGIRKLRPEFTFETFVVGEANRFAYINALQVAQNDTSVLNPLYIFGNVGLGKTHLMMAIGHYELANNVKKNVVYTTAQQFTENYFFYTNDQKGKHEIENFYDYYNSAEILLVDDIQYLEGKTKTQDEFFKIFDRLYERGIQIVITSDCKTSDLKLMDRLKSRFSWGLEVNIDTPDQNLREKIVFSKLGTLIPNPKDVPEEVVTKISNLFTSNIRELEGATRRFITYCVALDIPFTTENCDIALKDILKTKNENTKEFNSSNEIKKAISEYFKIPVTDLESSTRKSNIVYARNICFYIMREFFALPLKQIGGFFGNRDHATVAHGIEKLLSEEKITPGIKKDIEFIKKKLSLD